jgi:hypothetical protein
MLFRLRVLEYSRAATCACLSSYHPLLSSTLEATSIMMAMGHALLWLHEQPLAQPCAASTTHTVVSVLHSQLLPGAWLFVPLLHCVTAGGALSILPVRCLQPQLQLDPLAFCNSCCQLAGQLGLQLPQVPGEALLLRATTELRLPQVGLLLLLLFLDALDYVCYAAVVCVA